MNILILGHGVEGKSVENYFKSDPVLFEHTSIEVLDNFKKEELLFKDFSKYDLIFRTPSIPPKFIEADPKKVTSVTKFFFHHCPCPIIGVTGTKGKGTTCTMIRNILNNIFASESSRKAFLVGNIGIPALDELPNLTSSDVAVYELSSFQLWDMDISPAVSVILRLEPDHLDVHESFAEYLSAKQNIVNYQKEDDFCVYFKDNKDTVSMSQHSKAKKLSYPCSDRDSSADEISRSSNSGERSYSEGDDAEISQRANCDNFDTKTCEKLNEILDELQVPGAHNREDAEAALLAVFAFLKREGRDLTFSSFLETHESELRKTFHDFKALPHHIEFVRELNGVKYFDDSFSTVSPALRACLSAFDGTPFVLIVGGKDKGFDLFEVKRLIFDRPNLIKAVLIGETAAKLKDGEDPEKFIDCGTDFELAVTTARRLAEERLEQEEENSDTCLVDKKPEVKNPVVVLSPCASSFDMFKSYKDRGDQFKNLVNEL
ncbi:UDP-N-acetylmuramoyl-L-alanine--D-glutamate ligase [Candidatus Saccharibacteria bacterium]|nr:UDP-N-acetylmuramoyl-L-alanine--D-glutamate ligase [Candidatus Saccharibacteria bacterium]